MRRHEADCYKMTTEKALSLARDLKYGPLPRPEAPTPTVGEAVGIISEARRTCGHTWLTADAALEVLNEHQKRSKA
jgi:hypothetical protein